MFKHPFSFEGRIRRTEYGLSLIVYYVALIALAFLEESTGNNGITFIGYIPAFWFMLAQGTKRCHDRGNHGGWQLIPFYLFWMLFAEGDPKSNQYGPDPKGRTDLLDELLAEEPQQEPVQL